MQLVYRENHRFAVFVAVFHIFIDDYPVAPGRVRDLLLDLFGQLAEPLEVFSVGVGEIKLDFSVYLRFYPAVDGIGQGSPFDQVLERNLVNKSPGRADVVLTLSLMLNSC